MGGGGWNRAEMNPAEKLAAQYCCVKCHGKKCAVNAVMLPGSVAGLIGVGMGRYMAVSCALCGYTELYNLSAVALQKEPANAKAAPAVEKP